MMTLLAVIVTGLFVLWTIGAFVVGGIAADARRQESDVRRIEDLIVRTEVDRLHRDIEEFEEHGYD
jgi:hypothetical protein